jgi:hypothetical protein
MSPVRIAFLFLLGLLALAVGSPEREARADAQETFRASYAAGWNLVGGPAGAQFDGALGALLTLNDGQQGYTALESDAGVEAGRGYWAYFPSDTIVPIAAAGNADLPAVPVAAAGWLLVGNPTAQPLRLTGAEVAYQYDPAAGYSPLNLLLPGRGALVYSAAGGAITFAPAPARIISGAGPAPAVSSGAGLAPVASAASISVMSSGFGQSRQGGPITVAALVRNQGTAVDLVPISITVYDAAGGVIAAGDTTLHYLSAGETSGLAHRLTPKGAGAPARAEVIAGMGRAAGMPPPGALTFAQQALVPGHAGSQATAVISSSYTTDLTDIHVSAIVYDAAGAIVGGGATIKRLVPAGGSTGVALAADVSGPAARVEFYAQLP